VSLIWDNEDFTRCFLLVEPEQNGVLRFALFENDVASLREALRQMASGVKASSDAGRAGLSESASTATELLSQVASGILAALSESLKRQSERLRS
jgi:hypothetical protein